MKFSEYIKIAVGCITTNKLRTILTIMGIAVGICSVIAIVSIGQAGQTAISAELDKLGLKGINIKANTANHRDLLRVEDAKKIKQHISEVEEVTAVFNGFGTVRRNNRTRDVYIWGIDSYFNALYTIEIMHGRLINETDMRIGRNVVIIDEVLANMLFHRENAIGREFRLTSRNQSQTFTVIGVIKSSNELIGDLFGDKIPAFIYMPITTLQRIYDTDSVDHISLKVNHDQNADDVGVKVVKFLQRYRHNEETYYAENMMYQKERFYTITNIFTLVIGAIGGISLIVGGFGIMNIMLVSVTERISEIGIRKALGAKNKDILMQFLLEAIILTLLGAVIGISGGILFGLVISYWCGLSFEVPMTIIGVTLIFSILIGLTFGVYPASKAARLQPVEALRYE